MRAPIFLLSVTLLSVALVRPARSADAVGAADDSADSAQDDFVAGLRKTEGSMLNGVREMAVSSPQAPVPQDWKAFAECHRELRASGLGVPDFDPTACSGVTGMDNVGAVVDCYKTLSATGMDPRYLAPACRGVRDDAGAQAMASCQAKLKQDGVDAKFLAGACNGVRDEKGADAVASCHRKMGALGEDPNWHAAACAGVSDETAAESVAACHSALGQSGVEFKYFGTACAGAPDATAVRAVSSCYARLKSDGVAVNSIATACSGVRDQSSVEAVSACHRDMAALGEPAFAHAAACAGVRDMGEVRAVDDCHRGLIGKGVRDFRDRIIVCKATLNTVAPRPSSSAVPAVSALSAPGRSRPAPRAYYATDCSALPAWLSRVPDSADDLARGGYESLGGEFDSAGALFAVSARSPEKDGRVVARDRGRRAKALRVTRAAVRRFSVRTGGRIRTFRLCRVE